MGVPDYTGYWMGKIEGTIHGGLTLDIRQEGDGITGITKLSEPALGQYEYLISGVAAENLSLLLTPGRQSGGITLGNVQVIATIDLEGTLTGR